MADPSGPSMHQRRQYDAPGAGYHAPQQQQHQYYQQYVPAYNNYQTPHYQHQHQQPMQPQQWQHYYNHNYYPRSQPPYPQMSPYSYPHHANYQPRQMPVMHSPYASPNRAPHELPHQQAHAVSASPFEDHVNTMPPSPSPPAPVEFSGHRAPYYPPLPWLSVSDKPFPPRQPKSKRRPKPQSASQPVELPDRHTEIEEPKIASLQEEGTPLKTGEQPGREENSSPRDTEASAASQILSDKETTSSTATPLTTQTQPVSVSQHLPNHDQKSSVVIPVIPNIPSISKTGAESAKSHTTTTEHSVGLAADSQGEVAASADPTSEVPIAPLDAVKAPPKSWAELLRSRGGSAGPSTSTTQITSSQVVPDVVSKRSAVIGHAIDSFAIQKPNPEDKLSFLEPRGLVNSGNMCYMNSILQVLVFCVPFYNFLNHVGRNAVHSFKSDTPLLDSMILFMKEFAVIDAADSLEKLRLRLKPNELEQFGDPLLPDYVYDEIRRMPRFASMQRGHQQDAEEFLGFLFEELQGECARAIQASGLQQQIAVADTKDSLGAEKTDNDGWLEVGPKQRASTTRSSGSVDVDTPINRIFGGQLRSELRVPGVKNSVTLEPYQSLQLDIGSPEVRNITDALQGLTKPETLHGDFQSPRGAGATATKQVFVESLPPVLILHLKRFQYDNTGGTQKIWKKVGYPLELEIPKEAFPHVKRGSLAVRGGLPKYRLISVIYHHGKSATAGHYTTDILRQDGREWLRVDDTYLRRVRSQDVEGASEEDPKVLAAALEQHTRDQNGAVESIAGTMTADAEAVQSDKGWSQAKVGGKKWSGVVNGTAKSSGRATPVGPQSLKDNKVAYILFYEKIET